MNKTNLWKALLLVSLVAALTVPAAWAQQRRGPGKEMPMYDPATEATVKGTVERVEEHTGPMGWTGTHLVLKTEEEALEVHLGPSAFLAEKGFAFTQGDEIEVTGSRMKYEGEEALLARTVKKGEKSLTLRNAQGIPQWSKGGRQEPIGLGLRGKQGRDAQR